jgi:hypothetical protein
MGAIDIYIKGITRRYPDTREVREQIEELRDTLHLKTEELQAQGKPYEYAAREAIDSMGDVSPLLEEVSGNVRTVYINRLSRIYALVLSALLYVEFITAWVAVLLNSYAYPLTGEFVFSLFVLAVGAGIWLIATGVVYKRRPDETKVVEFSYGWLKRVALLGWLGLSVFLFIINLMTPSSTWFQYPLIGIANWPLGIWLYHKLLASGRYDVK